MGKEVRERGDENVMIDIFVFQFIPEKIEGSIQGYIKYKVA